MKYLNEPIQGETEQEIEDEVTTMLERKGLTIVKDEDEAERFLAEFDGEIFKWKIEEALVGYKEEGNWQKQIVVELYEYFKDPGSDFYVYSINVDVEL